jgi:uncharacterized repeat protein (TIGR03803 family)
MLYSFGPHADGHLPYGPLVADTQGVLYGTTSSGGSSNQGTVFSLSPPAGGSQAWAETQLLSFDGAVGGSQPLTGVVFGANGVLYGTTSTGGQSDAGTVFSLTPPVEPGGAWTEAVLYNFSGGADGSQPNYGPLLAGTGGVLYGMTSAGGTNGGGVVFSLTPPAIPGRAWTETVLWSFGGSATDGTNPLGGLVQDAAGVLYGGTAGGGKKGQGSVFSLTQPTKPGGAWTERVLYRLMGNQDGSAPMGNLLLGNGGVLYGITSLGGGPSNQGVAFSLTPPVTPGSAWQEQIIFRYSLIGTRQYNPRCGLVVSKTTGVLYGTTSGGGLGTVGGIITLTPPAAPGGAWVQNWIFHFISTDGGNPAGGLLWLNDTLYGTTYSGGEQNFGVVYEMTL